MIKILVIENEEQTRNMLLECLESKGFDAIGAENGLIGVERALWHLPDLIISEISIPELDGYNVLTMLRQNPTAATIPLIFVTAKVTRADIRKGIELGADDYLTKPCSVEELLRAIAACLEKRALLRQRLVAHPLQRVSQLPPSNTASIATLQSIFQSIPMLRKVFDFIKANYNRQITISEVAQVVGYSPAYLTSLVRQQTGQSIYRWIIHYRMAKACFLLLETDQKMNLIAANLGYQNVTSFHRQFRNYNGKSPQAWRTECRHFLAQSKQLQNN